MKKILLFILFTSGISLAQVGIETTTPRAALEVNSNTMGFLAPQVPLTNTTIDTPVVNPAGGGLAEGTIVYNTSTINDVTPGYYYWNGTIWVRMEAGASNGPHNTLDMAYDEGGAGVGRVINADAGAVYIENNNTADSGLSILNNSTTSGYSGQSNYVVHDNTIGIVTNVDANGVGILVDHNDTNNPYSGIQVFTYSNEISSAGIFTNTQANSPAIAVEAHGTTTPNAMTVTNFRTNGGAAIDAEGAIGIRSTSQVGTGSAFAGYLNATQGTAAQFNGTGITALTANNVFTGNHRYGVIAQGSPVGIYSNFTSANGAAFIGYASTYTAVWNGFTLVVGGTWHDVYNRTAAKTNNKKHFYNVIGSGMNATTIKKDDKTIVMPAVSAPENLFQDYGIGKLVNGRASITIDPILSENILVDKTHPLKVFIQLEGDCNGVYVTNKSATGFDVIELGSGTSNTPFSYSIVAIRADAKALKTEGGYDTFDYSNRFITIDDNVKTQATLLENERKENSSMKKLEKAKK